MPAMRNPGPLVGRPQRLSAMPRLGGPVASAPVGLLPVLRALVARPSFAPRHGMNVKRLRRLFDLARPEGTIFQGGIGANIIDEWGHHRPRRARARPRPRPSQRLYRGPH